MSNDTVTICSNPDCRVAETGRCVEGMELKTCPHYGREPEDLIDESALDESENDESASVRLPGGGTLTCVEASRLLRAGDARVIAIIGPSDAGKTSLIASLYDLFQEGAVSGIEYARSETLHAFEHTCHDARAASRRGVPHMNRTPLGDVRFYHLQVGGGAAGEGLALVLGDRAGEEYKGAADDAYLAMSFAEVRRADSLTVLVDGQRLLDSGARHNLRSEVVMVIQALVDGGAIQVGHRLALVLTKMDMVQVSDNRVRAEADFDSLMADIRRIFGEVISVIESFRIAASPKDGVAPRGMGISDLLHFWLEAAPTAVAVRSTTPRFSRAFARLVPVDA
jgi:hypothetical protein